jgi:hypothetical protein
MLASFVYKCEDRERAEMDGNITAGNDVEASTSCLAASLSIGKDDIIDTSDDEE